MAGFGDIDRDKKVSGKINRCSGHDVTTSKIAFGSARLDSHFRPIFSRYHGKEFWCRTMLTWLHERGVKLFLIEPGKSNQNVH